MLRSMGSCGAWRAPCPRLSWCWTARSMSMTCTGAQPGARGPARRWPIGGPESGRLWMMALSRFHGFPRTWVRGPWRLAGCRPWTSSAP
eukprot:2443406-Lingulodinium_polyedra.AAC.1